MRIPTSKRQDSKVRKELLYQLCLKYKLEHLDGDAIAAKLYAEGLGVEEAGVLKKPYSSAYISKLVREALKEVAASRDTYGKEMAVVIENDLDELLEAWRPLALGYTDDDGNEIPPNAKAAEVVRKCLSDKSTLLGSNAPVEQIISVRVDSALSNFVETLRNFMEESAFANLISAIDTATQLNSEYYQSRQLEGNDDILEATIVE
jgi:hypothetical protein